MMNPLKFAKLTLMIAALTVISPVFAQEIQDGADTTDSSTGDSEESSSKREKGYLNLSVGVYHDEKMSESIPDNISTAGTFRNFTKVEWNPQTKTMRFYPKSPGIGTLTIKHPNSGKILAEFTVDIRKTDLQKVAREMQALLQGIAG
jgi:pilus assembly protein CpaC